MIRRPPRSTQSRSSAASDVYKRQGAWEEKQAADRFVADLDRESVRLVDIIEDLLILSRVESDELALEEESFDVNELLDEVVEEKRDLAGRSEVEVIFSRAGAGTVLNGDRKLIKTACGNLLDNCLLYTSDAADDLLCVDL